MKALFLVFFAALSLNSYAVTLDLSGLHPLEIEAINQASTEEKALLVECLLDEKTMLIEIVKNTSCVNEVFGDVHN